MICVDKCMNVYVYMCIHTYVQTLVNVYINVYWYNTYIYISTYIYICIYTYCRSWFQCVLQCTGRVLQGVLRAVRVAGCGAVCVAGESG